MIFFFFFFKYFQFSKSLHCMYNSFSYGMKTWICVYVGYNTRCFFMMHIVEDILNKVISNEQTATAWTVSFKKVVCVCLCVWNICYHFTILYHTGIYHIYITVAVLLTYTHEQVTDVLARAEFGIDLGKLSERCNKVRGDCIQYIWVKHGPLWNK